MSRIHPNNFRTTLAADCSDVATSITLTDNLPTIAAGEWIILTITDNINYELLRINSNTGAPNYTIISRGLEGTSAQNWTTGAQVSIRVTKGSIDDKQDKLDDTTLDTVTLVAGDAIIIKDASDSNKTKQALASDLTSLNPLEKIGVFTCSSSSVITFTGLGSYAKIAFLFTDVLPSAEAVGAYSSLYLRTSSDNGATYDSGASDYGWVSARGQGGGSAVVGDYSNNTDKIVVIPGAATSTYPPDSNSGGAINGTVEVHNPSGTTNYKHFTWLMGYLQVQGFPAYASGSGHRKSSSAVDAVSFYPANGTYTSGVVTAYGYKF